MVSNRLPDGAATSLDDRPSRSIMTSSNPHDTRHTWTLPLPPISTPSLFSPVSSRIEKRQARKRLTLSEAWEQQLLNMTQKDDVSSPNSTTSRHRSPRSFSPPTPRALKFEPNSYPLSTYHIQDRSRKPAPLHSKHPQFWFRTETLFRKANQLALVGTEVYVVVRAADQYMVFNPKNPNSQSPPELRDSDTITTVHVSGVGNDS